MDDISKLTLINHAMLLIGLNKVQSLNDTSNRALVAIQSFDLVLNTVLQDGKWDFATKSIKKIQYTNSSQPWADVEFQIPIDYVRFLGVGNETSCCCSARSNFNMRIVNSRLVQVGTCGCSSSHDIIYYISNDLDYALMSGHFISAFAAALALKVIPSCAFNPTKNNELETSYKFHIAQANRIDTDEFKKSSIPKAPKNIRRNRIGYLW